MVFYVVVFFLMFILISLYLGYFVLRNGRLDIGIKVKVKSRRKEERYVLFKRFKIMGFKKVFYKCLYFYMFIIYMYIFY